MNNLSLISLVFAFVLSVVAVFVNADPLWRRILSAAIAFFVLAFILPK